MQVTDSYFEGGSDQQIDFEPTGFTFQADAGSTATTIVDSSANFTAWDVQPGDPVFNANEFVVATVRSVVSATQLTTTDVNSWANDGYVLLKHNYGHLIANNRFVRGTSINARTITLGATYSTTVADNIVEGGIEASVYNINCIIARNQVELNKNTDFTRAIEIQGSVQQLQILDNHIYVDSPALTDQRWGIHIQDQAGTPDRVTISRNMIRSATRLTGIYFAGRRVLVSDNTVILDTPGESTQSVGVYSRADEQVVTGNVISASNGGFLRGLDIGTGSAHRSCVVGGGAIDNATTPLYFNEAVGTFTVPPVLMPSGHDLGEVTPPASLPWCCIGGVGGVAPTTNSKKPAIYWGSGSPEGVLTAGVGSLAMRRDGGAGTCMYVKESGTGNTGWVAK